MSSLYAGRKAKPFQHNDDSDDDVVFYTAKKVEPLKRKTSSDSSDDDTDDSPVASKSSKIQKVGIDTVIDATIEEDDYRAQVKARMDTLNAATVVEEVEMVPAVRGKAPAAANNKHTRSAKALLKKINETKDSTPRNVKKGLCVDLSSPIEIVDLVEVSSYVVPQISTSAVRAPVKASTALSAADMNLERMLKLVGADASKIVASSSASAAAAGTGTGSSAPTEKPQCRLKTRLNGSHERKWRIAFDESFGKVRGKFAAVYGLKVTDVRFEFDGDIIKDTDTPQSLDMEDENMIDVKIDKGLLDQAVATANASSGGLPPVQEKPSVLIRTRLNGVHEAKWKIAMDEPLSKLRENFCAVYSLQGSQVRFEFDGDVVQDQDTAGALDMADNIVVDAKVDKALYSGALLSYNNKK